jgi:hypothetical protein
VLVVHNKNNVAERITILSRTDRTIKGVVENTRNVAFVTSAIEAGIITLDSGKE